MVNERKVKLWTKVVLFFFAGCSNIHCMVTLLVVQLSHIQITSESAVRNRKSCNWWNKTRQWFERSYCIGNYGIRVPSFGIPVFEKNEDSLTILMVNCQKKCRFFSFHTKGKGNYEVNESSAVKFWNHSPADCNIMNKFTCIWHKDK